MKKLLPIISVLSVAIFLWQMWKKSKRGTASGAVNVADYLEWSDAYGGYVDWTTGKVYNANGSQIGNAS